MEGDVTGGDARVSSATKVVTGIFGKFRTLWSGSQHLDNNINSLVSVTTF